MLISISNVENVPNRIRFPIQNNLLWAYFETFAWTWLMGLNWVSTKLLFGLLLTSKLAVYYCKYKIYLEQYCREDLSAAHQRPSLFLHRAAVMKKPRSRCPTMMLLENCLFLWIITRATNKWFTKNCDDLD